jgi:hypothetical protein
MQAMHESSEGQPEDAPPAHALESSPERARPIGRVWVVVGLVALLVGIAMGLIMSTVSS